MSKRVVSERLIVTIDFAAWMGGSFFQISPDSQRVTYAARVGAKQFVVVDGNEEKLYDAIVPDTLNFSPDSQRVAYVARVGTEQLVVVDGNQKQHYDGILEGTLSFSPDSQRVAYAVRVGAKQFVVVDGKKEKHYDAIVTTGGGRVIFDPENNLRYLAGKGSAIYLVEERIKGTEHCNYAGAFHARCF
jgi:hypothetical protein